MQVFRKMMGKTDAPPPVQRVDPVWRQSSFQFVRNIHQQKQKDRLKTDPEQKHMNLVFLLAEVCDLINNLERRLFCFLTELETYQALPWKHRLLVELYNRIAPDVGSIMQATDYLRYEENIRGRSENDLFLRNMYYKIMKNLNSISAQLLLYVKDRKNMQSMNYQYKHQQYTGIPGCYRQADAVVGQFLKKKAPNPQVNKARQEVLADCLERNCMPRECGDILKDRSRDVFLMQAFMRIPLLIKSFQKERAKLGVDDLIETRTAQQETKIDRVFQQLGKWVSGSANLSRKPVLLGKKTTCAKKLTPPQQKPATATTTMKMGPVQTIPEQVRDPITFELLETPVVANDGVIYNQGTARRLIQDHKKGMKLIFLDKIKTPAEWTGEQRARMDQVRKKVQEYRKIPSS